MHDTMPAFLDAQWDTLALLNLMSGPIPMDILAGLSPLEPGPFFDVINHALSCGWIRKDIDHTLSMAQALPFGLQTTLRERLSPQKIAACLQTLTQGHLDSRLEPECMAPLLCGAGQGLDAAALLFEAAFSAVEDRDIQKAHRLCAHAVRILEDQGGSPEKDVLFVKVVLTLSRLSLLLGTNLDEPPALLLSAAVTAERLGDRRSLALAKLHAGVYAYLADKISCALEELRAGIDIVENLGDEDIRNQTAEYRGIHAYIQGLYREAAECFEKAMIYESDTMLFNFAVPLFLGHSAALLGQFHRAIGVLDASWRRACVNGERTHATLYQASLGLVLLRMGRSKEALEHILQARDDAIAQDNNRALYFAQRGMILYHYLEGYAEKVVEIAHKFIPTNKGEYTWPYGPQYTWPIFLEMNYKYYDLGYTPIQEHLPLKDMEKLIDGPNLNLRGAMLRIVALRKMATGAAPLEVEHMLKTSEADLLRSGDPVELAKTRIAMARLNLHQQRQDEARKLALMAWEGMRAFPWRSFPDDLKKLLPGVQDPPAGATQGENVLGRFMDMLDEFVPSTDQEDLLFRFVSSACRFFGAERGGLFWGPERKGKRSAVLRAGYNLTQREIEGDDFSSRRDLIARTLQNRQPLVFTTEEDRVAHTGQVTEVLCLPLTIRGTLEGVVFFENTYIRKDYRLFERSLLIKIARRASSCIERIEGYRRLIEEQASLIAEESKGSGGRYGLEIIASSPPMQKLLDQTDEVARSDAPVLILGETGVGKELLARRIHAASSRCNGPFVAVEFSSIPENLIESELFGHEKGAFTGADRQKPGRLELANRGTFFIDEAGDIPRSVQVKLLRTLQEKSFVRIGGTRTLSSDFRLVSATNRDLMKEVSAGNFREDLYYRLNVVPFLIPPLRERGDDILDLARYFLALYARKYGKRGLTILSDDEARINAYRWPGNVRELQNIMERSVILSRDGLFELKLPEGPLEFMSAGTSKVLSLDEMQRRHIKAVIDLTGGRIDGPDGAARLLGMKRTTLYARMKKLGIPGGHNQ